MLNLRKPSVKSLQKKSAAIVDVFTKTKQQFDDVNSQIATHVAKKQEQIASLQSEVSTLTSISTQNAKVAGKIEAFLAE